MIWYWFGRAVWMQAMVGSWVACDVICEKHARALREKSWEKQGASVRRLEMVNRDMQYSTTWLCRVGATCWEICCRDIWRDICRVRNWRHYHDVATCCTTCRQHVADMSSRWDFRARKRHATCQNWPLRRRQKVEGETHNPEIMGGARKWGGVLRNLTT